jgi:hypothetical protein
MSQSLPGNLREVVAEVEPQRPTSIPFHTDDGRLIFLPIKKAA